MAIPTYPDVDAGYTKVLAVLRSRGPLRLVSPEGESVQLPEELVEKFIEVVSIMATGRTAIIVADRR